MAKVFIKLVKDTCAGVSQHETVVAHDAIVAAQSWKTENKTCVMLANGFEFYSHEPLADFIARCEGASNA